MPDPYSILIVGVGNTFRSDDGAGLEVARRLRDRLPDGVEVVEGIGDGTDLLRLWDGRKKVYIVDALHADLSAGEIRRFDLPGERLPAEYASIQSTHSFNIADAVELADTLAALPDSLTIFGIQGAVFSTGTEMSEDVMKAVKQVVDAILIEIDEIDTV